MINYSAISMDDPQVVHKNYRNYKGEVALRHFIPVMMRFDKTNKWHGENVWIVHAWDMEKQDFRDFCLQDFIE